MMTSKYLESNTTKFKFNGDVYVLYNDMVANLGIFKEVNEFMEFAPVLGLEFNLDGINHEIMTMMLDSFDKKIQILDLKDVLKLINCMKYFLVDENHIIDVVSQFLNKYTLMQIMRELVNILYDDSVKFMIEIIFMKLKKKGFVYGKISKEKFLNFKNLILNSKFYEYELKYIVLIGLISNLKIFLYNQYTYDRKNEDLVNMIYRICEVSKNYHVKESEIIFDNEIILTNSDFCVDITHKILAHPENGMDREYINYIYIKHEAKLKIAPYIAEQILGKN
jgi:hypothetical protein